MRANAILSMLAAMLLATLTNPGLAGAVVPEPLPVSGSQFADYPTVPVDMPATYQGVDLPLPVDLNRVRFIERRTFTTEQQALLARNGFVVTPSQYPDWQYEEFFQLYDSASYDEAPVYVTTDALLHIYHLLFDKILRELEEERLLPELRGLVDALNASAQAQYRATLHTPLEDQARRVWAYCAVAQQLLAVEPLPVPAEIRPEVEAELALIMAHEGLRLSPLLSTKEALAAGPLPDPGATPAQAKGQYVEDYSQYTPRGHYTRTKERERYFRAMMWFGRINFRLSEYPETQMALLLTRALGLASVDGRPATDAWMRIYDPTGFMVGAADDLTFRDYRPLAEQVFGAELSLQQLADGAKLQQFVKLAQALPGPRINSLWVYIWEDERQVTPGFRLMGQRFVLDAAVFEQMIWRNVGEMGNERWLPSGLDFMAALGSDEARTILSEMGETKYANYEQQLAKAKQLLAALEPAEWTGTLYASWLYTLAPLAEAKGAVYPAYMRTAAWARKDLQSALGSWTELKHDTILYAKQVMAEAGSGAPPEVVRSWAEPNPLVFARLLALARQTKTGLESRGLLTESAAKLLTALDEQLSFLTDAAARELRGETLADADYEHLTFLGGWMEWMTLEAADKPQAEDEYARFYTDDRAAIVADVATDPNGRVLEEGTGYIWELYVVVPGANGPELAKGGVYSYYEFPWPIDDRLTDEKWRDMLENKQAPPRPVWTGLFSAE